jgi:hypothetical protein
MVFHSGPGTLGYDNNEGVFKFGTLVWDTTGLTWVRMTQPGSVGGGGGGGGPATIANGADVAEGATTDAEAAAGDGTVIALLKRVRTLLSGPLSVTGAFFQATQPVSIATSVGVLGPLTDGQLRAVAVPVSGTVTANTGLEQPLTDTQLRAAAVPVSGAFYQATQPVSLASMPSTPVTGVFFQATQPVSAAALPLPAGAATETTLAALNAKVTAVNTGATVISSALPAGTNAIGAITNTTFAVTQATPASLQMTATPIALTKGTQSAVGFSVQNLKDAGRNQTNYFMASLVAATATETLQSLTGYKGGVAVAATTAPAVVTAGKTYRLQSLTITYVGLATAAEALVNLRANLAGAVVVSSPLVAGWVVGEAEAATAAIAGGSQTVTISFPDGMEFAAGTGMGISVLGQSAVGAAAAAGFVKVTLTGYEY